MQTGRVQGQRGYAVIVQRLAQQAIAAAFDTAPHRPPKGELRWPMAEALPAARVLIDQADDVDCDGLAANAEALKHTVISPTGKVTDGFGHTRPVYGYLAVHLLYHAAKLAGNDTALASLQEVAAHQLAQPIDQPDPRLALWRHHLAVTFGLKPPMMDWPNADEPTPLVELGLNDLVDSWTYRELVGLHGLHLCAQLHNREDLVSRVEQTTLYHLGHTQPDYTTYQPWGLAAFASNPQTTVFAEQQLHDVATHLSIEGPGGAVLPALLLADASAMLAGRYSVG